MFSFLSLVAIGLGVLGWYGANQEIFSPIFGFYLTIGSGAAIVIFAIIGLLARGGEKRTPILPIILSLPVLAGAGWIGYIGYKNPINDITTDPSSPIEFTFPAYRLLAPQSETFLDKNFLIQRPYNPEFAEKQKELYPYIIPLKIDASPNVVYQELENSVASIEGLQLVYKNPEQMKFEFISKSKQYLFIDDVALQVRGGPESTSFIHIRSRSRVGKSDLGMNSKRIFDILEFLRSKIKVRAEQKASANAAMPSNSPPGLPETAPKVQANAPTTATTSPPKSNTPPVTGTKP